jgi:hypothetical protein
MTGLFEALGQDELDAATAKKTNKIEKELNPENFHFYEVSRRGIV